MIRPSPFSRSAFEAAIFPDILRQVRAQGDDGSILVRVDDLILHSRNLETAALELNAANMALAQFVESQSNLQDDSFAWFAEVQERQAEVADNLAARNFGEAATSAELLGAAAMEELIE